MQTLRQRVLHYIRKYELLKPGDRVGIAVSGGADSVALLRLLLDLRKEIGIIVSVVHFNHKLRGDASEEDERFVAQLSWEHKLELHSESGQVAAHAEKKHLSLETAARDMRYQYFRSLLGQHRLNRIATGHTLDDQAETVLLKIVRGAGTRGLAGVYPELSVPGSQFSASIIRPLLAVRRKDLEAHLVELGQSWREDQSNRDLRHMRNRVRHGILPRLERYLNLGVREALAETAEIARAEEEYWKKEVERVSPLLWAEDALKVSALAELPLALQRRVIRAAGESRGVRLDFHHVEEILTLVQARSAKSAELPGGLVVTRNKGALRFEPPGSRPSELAYEYCLSIPGSVEVPETESHFEAVLVPRNAAKGYNPEDLLDRSLLAKELKVRNWRPGDRFWPAHSKVPTKVKELLQERHVSGPERKLWPVMVSGIEVVWVRGFRAPAHLLAQSDEAVLLREVKS